MYLNCHTYFSLKYGTLSPEQLILEAIDKGVETLALTDINNTSATFDFYTSCKKHNINPLIGIEFHNEGKLVYVGIAQNNSGFHELNAHFSLHQHTNKRFSSTAPEFNNAYIIYPFGSKTPEELRDNEFIGIKISDLNKLITSDIKKRQDKLLIFHPVTFKDKTGYINHRLLRAIDKNTLISKLTSNEHASIDEVMLPMEKLMSAFSNFPAIIDTTRRFINSCTIEFNSENKNRKFYNNLNDDKLLLEKLAMEGLSQRYGLNNKEAHDRVVRELTIINDLGFNTYFLIASDILRYATHSNFDYIGRGSGGNSIVAYCLKITDVEPMELELYFERFLNSHRQKQPPDFDIDFSWKDRDKVIEYIFQKYGTSHTALLCTHSTMKGKAVVRELGKVFGLPKSEIDLLIRSQKNKDAQNDKYVDWIFTYGKHIENFPQHLGIHAGGILIGQNPIHCYTATDLPPKGFPITHFDMFTAESMGYYKYDILSQRGLGHIKDTKALVQKNKGERIEIYTEKAKEDISVKNYLKEGNTIGCFYLESPAMRMLLKQLKCQDYKTLVAASSIIRPGVAQSGMMKEYIYRFNNPGKFQYQHPIMEKLLKETYGVMVYQEDVIKVAHHFADFTLEEADILRRAMCGKFKGNSGFKLVKNKFFDNCKKIGHSDELTKEVWTQIESFGGFSFSKAHSASFAVESYHSLYLKAHYPLEFITAVIKNWGGFYSREFYIQEARKNGATVEAPCVNNSDICTDINGTTIYIGFEHIKGIEQKISEAICKERIANGHYKNLEDFIKRISLGLEQLNILIRVGGFKFTGESKKVLLLRAALLFSERKNKPRQPELFASEYKAPPVLPKLDSFVFEDAYDELELLDFPVCFPFELLPPEFKGDITAREMEKHVGKVKTIIGYYVTVKDSYTRNNEHMAFGHFLDCNGDTFDTTHFPDSLKRYPFQERGFYLLKGKIALEFDYPSMEVHYMEKLPMAKKEIINQ